MQGNKRSRSEYGAVTIVEATFVFPIVFFMVFFMLMLGSVYFQQARVENIVIRTAIETAARCENPMQDVINGADAVPTSVTSDGIKPYRYIFTGNSQNICNEMAAKMKEEINSFGSLGFSGMEVHMLGDPSIDLSSYFIVSYIQCEADFYVEFPIRMIFSDQSYNFDFHVGVKQPISDAAEFVRNVSTVQDLLDRSSYWEKFMEKFTSAADKVNKFINGGSANSGNQQSVHQRDSYSDAGGSQLNAETYPVVQEELDEDKKDQELYDSSVSNSSYPVNYQDYNMAGSSSVGKITSVINTNDLHSMPTHGTPNSVLRNYKNGKLYTERYYDNNGVPYLDIDYTDHGNSKYHPDVPHEHSLYFDEDGKLCHNDPPEGGIKK